MAKETALRYVMKYLSKCILLTYFIGTWRAESLLKLEEVSLSKLSQARLSIYFLDIHMNFVYISLCEEVFGSYLLFFMGRRLDFVVCSSLCLPVYV